MKALRIFVFLLVISSPIMFVSPRECYRCAKVVLTEPVAEWHAWAVVWPLMLAFGGVACMVVAS